MDSSGRIHEVKDADHKEELQKEYGPLKELSYTQARDMKNRSRKFRKNCMRNKPCPCGSGKKFKKCCALKVHKAV